MSEQQNSTPSSTRQGATVQAAPPLAGHKRKANPQLQGRPAGGIHFTEPRKSRKIHELMDVSMGQSASEAEAERTKDESKKEEEQKAKEALEKEKKDFFDGWTSEMQITDSPGTIRFPKQSYGRYTPFADWMRHAKDSRNLGEELFQAAKAKKPWVWLQVYKHPTPGKAQLDMLVAALGRIQILETVEGFQANHYTLCAGVKASGKYYPSIAAICEDEAARKRLMMVGNFAYHTESDEIGVFVQGSLQIGTSITVDLHNAPPDPAVVLLGCYKIFGHVILWSKAKPDALEPVEFKYGKVTRATPKGSRDDPRTDVWRISFKFDSKKLKGWTYPKSAGMYGARGEIAIQRAPWCENCLAYAHDRKHCEWWRDAQLTSNKAKPKDFIEMKWTEHKSFAAEAKKLAELGSQIMGPVQTAGSEQS
ncbi:hypothetical protein M407DRAFT_17740 [Tulasnella calospora MUT 4182]|uniref:Uncharacterized protein n=1 Tax=Tulasnella calospora MUT 4182 TaxID=1051891 RepID=A0A0C3QLA0_9AGAM|nr:hypothetical protein M407DRAFT_17740 [Tulasnella calospora MUT 4182]